MVVVVQQVSLGIADCNMHPWKFYPSLVRLNDFSNMLLNHLIKPNVARKFAMKYRPLILSVLNFLCFCDNQNGRLFLGGSHQVHGHKPFMEGEVRRFHNGSASQSGAGSAFLTLKLFNAFHPIIFGTLTFPTDNSFMLTLFQKGISTRLFVRKSIQKIYKLHSQCFDTKLMAHNVTYLCFGT